jgi:predicted RNA-binding protein with PIN domain
MQNLKHYIIDGNNLIGKDAFLSKIQRADKQNARRQVVALLETFARSKKIKISLHFDGFPDESTKSNIFQINFSFKKTADYFIKKEIDIRANKSDIIVVTSDSNIIQYAKVSGCSSILSEQFIAELKPGKPQDDEEERIKQLNNISEFKKLFGVD